MQGRSTTQPLKGSGSCCRYAKLWFGPHFNCHVPRIKPIQLNPYFARLVGRIKLRTSVQRPRALLIFATVSGNTKQLAMRVSPLPNTAEHSRHPTPEARRLFLQPPGFRNLAPCSGGVPPRVSTWLQVS